MRLLMKKQTTIIERWNKAEAQSKEQKKNEERFEVFKEDAEKLIKQSGELAGQKYSLFQPNTRVLAVDQELVVKTNISLTRITQLLEEVSKNSLIFMKDFLNENVLQGHTYTVKLNEADKSAATSVLERLGNCLKLLQVERQSHFCWSGEKYFLF